MKIHTSILLCAVLGVHSYRQPKEIAQRRQIQSYSSNIVHENPNYPDQAAQSSVKVNYNTDNTDLNQQIYRSNPYQKPRQEFAHPSQSQLFNVGYSVSFTGNNRPKAPKQQKFTRTSLDDGEIITGTRKHNEEVQVPSSFPQSTFTGTKRQKAAGLKQKSQFPTNFPNPKTLISQANLSPNTQKYYRALEQAKPQVQNSQELQQKYSWRNLSPGVEIIRSTEVPAATTPPKYARPESSGFDHEKALGRSQEFDSSNALDNSNAGLQPNVFYYNPRAQQQQQQQVDTSLLQQHIPIQVDARFVEDAARNRFVVLANPKYSPQQPQDVNYAEQTVNYEQAYRTIPLEEASENKPVQVVYQPQQIYQSEPRFQYKIYGKPQPLSAFNEPSGEQIRRHPRYLGDIHTNLRPPPFETNYQRRIRLG